MGRRRFIGLLSSLGLSATSLRYMSKDAAAATTSNPKEEVPYVAEIKIKDAEKYADELPNKPLPTEPIVETVPRDRWVRVKAATNAAERLQRSLEKQGISSVMVTVGVNKSGNREIVVEHRTSYLPKVNHSEVNGTKHPETIELVPHRPNVSADDLRSSLPESTSGIAGSGENAVKVSDIPVRVVEKDMKLIAYFNERYRPVAAGSQVEVYPDFSPYQTRGTNCSPFYSNYTGERQMVTAGHNFDRADDDRYYKNVQQPAKNYTGSPDNYVGSRSAVTFDGTPEGYDAGTWTPESGIGLTNSLAQDGGGTRKTIGGIITRSKIENEAGNSSWTIKKQGRTTGIKSGYVESMVPNRKYRTTCNGSGGDSGGPFYHVKSDGKAYIAGMVTAATLDGTETEGHDIQWIMSNFNLAL